MRILILFFIAQLAIAQTTQSEVFVGSLTYHFFDFDSKAKNFKNKQSSDGLLISNPMLGYLHHTPYEGDKILSRGVVVLEDSIAQPAIGIFQSNAKAYSDFFEGGFFYGTYIINGDKWKEADMKVPMSFKLISSAWIVPMLGLKLTNRLSISETKEIRFNTLISPTLVTINVGFSWDN